MEQDCVFINGSPQNTFLPGMKDIKKGIYIGNDFKTGQTKFKTAFMDFLTGAGIKPKSIVSYNHLGNNDGKNLSSEKQFKSKETSKSECISDILTNSHLFKDARKNP
jgi:myo-inositol-1-phosphate synthase